MTKGATISAVAWAPSRVDAEAEYESVLDLHRSSKATLGLLPYPAFEEAARRGRLYLGFIDDKLCGYVLFSTPRQHALKLVHVCVSISARGSGLGKVMIDAVVATNPGRSILTAHCREDYNMDGFWRSLDMAPTGQRPGRSTAGSVLTIWTRKIGELDLFENALYGSARPIAVLDSNVVIDLFGSAAFPRPDRQESLGLGADWLEDLIELSISQEVSVDLSAIEPESERRQIQGGTGGLVTLRRNKGMRELAAEIVSRMPKHLTTRDLSLADDAKHLADSILGGADYFVTRDENLLRASAEWIRDEFDLEVLRPVELLQRFIPPKAPIEFRSGQLESVGLKWDQLTASSTDLEDAFVDVTSGEKGSLLRKRLRAVLAKPGSARLEVLLDDRERQWALLGIEVRGCDLEVPVMRVARGPLGATIAFQLARYLRLLAFENSATRIRVLEPLIAPGLLAVLEGDGFSGTPLEARLSRHPNLAEVSDVLSPYEVADYERKNWPQVLLQRPIPTLVVPIQPRYARELIGFNDTLIFERERKALGFAREFVYFAAPKSKKWAVPSRVLWYVSKDPKSTESSAVRAVVAHSRLVEARVVQTEDAIEQFRSLGVLRRREIEQHSRDGRVQILRFEDTQEFGVPVGRAVFNRMLKTHGMKPPILTMRSAPPTLFDAVLRTQPGQE